MYLSGSAVRMASNVFGAKRFVPTPPDKGSFPLDHQGECKEFYLKYMKCLSSNDHRNTSCRSESRAYLDCRMKNGLMAKEGWDSLGLGDVGGGGEDKEMKK